MPSTVRPLWIPSGKERPRQQTAPSLPTTVSPYSLPTIMISSTIRSWQRSFWPSRITMARPLKFTISPTITPMRIWQLWRLSICGRKSGSTRSWWNWRASRRHPTRTRSCVPGPTRYTTWIPWAIWSATGPRPANPSPADILFRTNTILSSLRLPATARMRQSV